MQGYEASFHDIAAKRFFGNDIEAIHCDSFKEVFKSINNKVAERAICAIENSLYGSINETYDLLLENDFSIIGEIYLRIEQCLIGLDGANLNDITEVYSHPVALAQCEAYLDDCLPNSDRHELHDTAASVEKIKNLGNTKAAAIAGKEAAKLYELKIIASSIETNKQNFTRFVAISPRTSVIKDSNKTSMIIKTSHKPGALYNALGVFAKRSINLSKLQSRPIIGKAWHYLFYVDVEVGMIDDNLVEAINELATQGCEVKVLGSYLGSQKY